MRTKCLMAILIGFCVSCILEKEKKSSNNQLYFEVTTCVRLLLDSNYTEINSIHGYTDINIIRNNINKYSNKDKQFLMDGCRKYILYTNSAMDDVLSWSERYYTSGNTSKKIQGTVTEKYAKDLSENYGLKNEINRYDSLMQNLLEVIKRKDLKDFTKKDIEELKANIKIKFREIKEISDRNFRRTFYRLFIEN
jgi:hypothetical protein